MVGVLRFRISQRARCVFRTRSARASRGDEEKLIKPLSIRLHVTAGRFGVRNLRRGWTARCDTVESSARDAQGPRALTVGTYCELTDSGWLVRVIARHTKE